MMTIGNHFRKKTIYNIGEEQANKNKDTGELSKIL